MPFLIDPTRLAVLAVPFEPLGGSVPLSGSLATVVRRVFEYSSRPSLQCVLPLMLAGINAFEIGEIVVERITVSVMDLAIVRHRAVMLLPNRAVEVGRTRLAPLMAAVIVAR